MPKTPQLIALSAVVLALCACEKNAYPAPAEAGVCYQAIFMRKGEAISDVKFNKLTEHEPRIEKCAASLEAMRRHFASMGGAQEIVGAYQGNYIFLLNDGIFRSDTLTGARYPMLVRVGSQLVAPGSAPQTQ